MLFLLHPLPSPALAHKTVIAQGEERKQGWTDAGSPAAPHHPTVHPLNRDALNQCFEPLLTLHVSAHITFQCTFPKQTSLTGCFFCLRVPCEPPRVPLQLCYLQRILLITAPNSISPLLQQQIKALEPLLKNRVKLNIYPSLYVYQSSKQHYRRSDIQDLSIPATIPVHFAAFLCISLTRTCLLKSKDLFF